MVKISNTKYELYGMVIDRIGKNNFLTKVFLSRAQSQIILFLGEQLNIYGYESKRLSFAMEELHREQHRILMMVN